MATAIMATTLAGSTVAVARQSEGMAARLLAKAGKPEPQRQGERVVSGDALLPVVINGHPLHLRIEPSLPGMVSLRPAAQKQLGLEAGGLFGIGLCYRVGRQSACGGTRVTQFAWGSEKPAKRRIGWISRDYRLPADGTVGPAGLPERTIRFALHPARAGERTVALAMHGGSGLFGGYPISGIATVAGTPIRIRFDPHHPRSLANASAAIVLAASNAGTMTAETGRQEIAFGIERPYRMMKLARPLTLGGLSLASLGVRVTDGDIAGRIAEEGAAAEAADPDEVVVTGRKKGKPPVNLLILGADALAGCSSIVFDKPAREIQLTCGG